MDERWRYERAACQRKEERRREADDPDRQKCERHIQEEPAALRCSCCHGGPHRTVLLRSNAGVERRAAFRASAWTSGQVAAAWRMGNTATPQNVRPAPPLNDSQAPRRRAEPWRCCAGVTRLVPIALQQPRARHGPLYLCLDAEHLA